MYPWKDGHKEAQLLRTHLHPPNGPTLFLASEH